MTPKKLSFLAILAILSIFTIVTTALAFDKDELRAVREAVHFRKPQQAQAAGYDLLPGLDHCFDNPGVGAMGYHYIDANALDTTLIPTHPEAIVYAPQSDGRLKLAAVEYIVPVDAWTATGAKELPQLFDQRFHLNEALGVYVLHVWLWFPNPTGLFQDWNPNVTCP